MIALNPNSERFLSQSVTSSSRPHSYLAMVLLYQDFIHSLIRARHRKVEMEFSEYYSDEKNLLRKIAALKKAYESIGGSITVNKLIDNLKEYYGLDYTTAASEERKNIFDPAMISYFYLSGQSTRNKTVDFIHKSFKEHLLAEYYIESMLDYNNRHYLNVGMLSDQTLQHLAGLLELVTNEDENLKEQTDNFIMSLKNQHGKTLKETLIDNATKIFESEEIVIFQIREDNNNYKKGWNTVSHIPSNKYRELWIHRWLSLYIWNFLAQNKINKNILSNFILFTSHNTPSSLKRLTGMDLSGASLSCVNFSHADLPRAHLSYADLSRANLSYADLYNADLSRANLSRANLYNADLSRAKFTAVINLPIPIDKAREHGAII